jgi:lipopolysaccharide cholinephosphotransferase
LKKCLLFGASTGGQNFLKNQTEYDVKAIIDNDLNKQGKYLNGLLVISPEQINQYSYDYIIVTSIYFESITEQLVKHLGVSQDKIIYPPKRWLKKEDINTFEHKETRAMAINVLQFTCEYLEKNDKEYCVLLGTLLGLVRDGDLIPWDDDIDIGIKRFFNEKNFIDDFKKYFDGKIPNCSFLVKESEEYGIVGLDIKIHNPEIYPFTLSIDFMVEGDEYFYLPLDTFPKEYFRKYEQIEFEGRLYRAPYPKEEFLTYTYGDWKTVRKHVSYQDNTNTYSEPKGLNIVEI